MDFTDPNSAVCGGYMFKTSADDLNGGFDAVTPPATSSGIPMPDPGSVAGLQGTNGFNADVSAQNIITDPNAMGMNTPGGMSFGPSWLANPSLARQYAYGDNDADERIGPAAYTQNDSL